MKKNAPSIDGFIPRRPGSQLGELHDLKDVDKAVAPIDRSLHTGDNYSTELVGTPRVGKEIGRDDLDESLRSIDDPETDKKSKRAKRRKDKKSDRRPRSKAKRIIKWVLISLGIIAVLVAGYVFLKAVLAGNSIFKGSFLDIVQSQRLKEDQNGRSNFLIFGTEAEGHPGADLTDSIMVMSIDQDEKNAYMVSLPRDLWVEFDAPCDLGNQSKLNAVYYCGSDDGVDEPAGADALRKKAGEITGLDVQYYIHVNWAAVTDAVNAVGGVDVKIESEDPRGILDRGMDWTCNYTCYLVNYKNGEVAHLDGIHALALARARNAQGGYGLPGGNFDREQNQQKIIRALREKAVSAGTLTNIGAITGLIDTLGKNFRTNIETKEVRTLMDIGRDIKNEDIHSLTLVGEEEPLVTTGAYNGQSIVRPIAGLFDYSDIAAYIEKNLTSDPVTREAAHVTVLNGSGTSGVAQQQADKLEELGFVVDGVDNAPEGNYGKATIYQINKDKTASAAKLKEIYGVTPKTTAPPVSVVGETDFLVIIGTAPTQ